jgi:tetratricopeptide (TPR) repeat protein
MRWKSVKVLLSASAAAIAAGVLVAPTTAIAQECPGEEGGPSATLSPRIGQELQKLYELLQNDQQQAAIAGMQQLLANRGSSMSAYETSTVQEILGSAYAQVENFDGARRAFQAALNANGLPPNRNNQLRYFIAQLQFQDGNYQAAIQGLNGWINLARRCNVPVDNSAWYLLGAAYTQISPPQWRNAMTPAENAVNGLDPANPNKSYFDLLNLIYSELGESTKRGALLERMINIWPGEKSYWTQLSGLYSTQQRDADAFSVIEVAYRAGLLTTESELKTVVQYYSFFENPYRGAKMLEREMNAGNIRRTQDNLVLLSQLWSQAREHKRSIPILQEAAGNSSEGELSLQLGRVLLADEQYAASQRALEQAINKGRMDSKDTGEAWLLLGTARFSQAGPEDVAIWANSKRAFQNAQRYQTARAQATQWIAYISAVEQTYQDQLALQRLQEIERCEGDLDRIESQERIEDLQNARPSAAEVARREEIRDRCGRLIAGEDVEDAPADEPAPAGGDEEGGE